MPRFSNIQPFTQYRYTVNISFKDIEEWIDKRNMTIEVELDPVFQRGHVWTEDKQIKYIEFILRGGRSGRDIYWNCPGWMKDFRGPLVLVDGKQRLTAISRFLNNEIPAFRYFSNEYEDPIPYLETMMNFHINDLPNEKDVLQWYLELNDGGVVHTDEELNKVRMMLEKLKKG